MAAASSGQPDVVAEILAHHPEVNARNDSGRTAIFFPASPWLIREDRTDRSDAVIDLLVQAGADVNAQDRAGNSVLHATLSEHVAQALIRNGANMNLRNNVGKTPLMVSTSGQVQRLLKQAGAQRTDGL
jgi:uncharacterized protein